MLSLLEVPHSTGHRERNEGLRPTSSVLPHLVGENAFSPEIPLALVLVQDTSTDEEELRQLLGSELFRICIWLMRSLANFGQFRARRYSLAKFGESDGCVPGGPASGDLRIPAEFENQVDEGGQDGEAAKNLAHVG